MNNNIFQLNKKKIFVIGGSGLIGYDLCNLLSSLGGSVFNLDIKNKNNKIKFIKFDVSKRQLIEKKLKLLLKIYGIPDVFVNCSYPASKLWGKSSFSKVKQKGIYDNLNLHLNSYIWIARIVAEEMRKKKIKGSIIQLGSHYGVIGQNSDIYKGTHMHENMIYSAIKGGIINNTRQMCSHYGKYGIRVNCVCPGGIIGHVKGKKIGQHKNFIKNYSKRAPLGRLARSDEISPSIAFLASDASSYISGITLMVDGGWTAT
jgi:NAD(P)-dependent dehydrogenase (short-subunit alcohol dehydrogenase family)